MNDGGDPERLVSIQLLGVPLGLQQRAAEHNDGLRREFQLLVEHGEAARESVPDRLVKVAAELDRRFLAFTQTTRTELERAASRGVDQIDVTLQLPAAAGPAAAEFGELLHEADEYCAAGRHLLTLAAPPDVVAFRKWVLGELVRQIHGEAPVSWRQFSESSS
ncbi:MAG TPA: hypothetical protein VHJ78_11015 [Actinomycetota bacterium]|nr:hypothetical protein [Actinomycetota bacterium]